MVLNLILDCFTLQIKQRHVLMQWTMKYDCIIKKCMDLVVIMYYILLCITCTMTMFISGCLNPLGHRAWISENDIVSFAAVNLI